MKEMKTTTRRILEKKYLLARGTTKVDNLSDVELMFGVVADDADAMRDVAELYRGFILGDNPVNPIITVINRYEIY